MLSDKELARLTNTLEVPLIVQEILNGETMLSPDVQYSLHEIISNYQPDAALLCIALSARKIASRYQNQSPNMAVMKIECDRIITDYARIWMDHATKQNLDDNLVLDTLEQIPEDLEAIAELIEINMAILNIQSEDTAGLAEILAVQAHAQALIADTFIDMIDQNNEPAITETIALPVQAYNDNIIPFPGTGTDTSISA